MNMVEPCPRCGEEKILVARNMKATRHCTRCSFEWEPSAKRPGVSDEELREAKRYWMEVLGMAEPKYCCNGVWECFCMGRESMREMLVDELDCQAAFSYELGKRAERERSRGLLRALDHYAKLQDYETLPMIAIKALAEYRGFGEEEG